MTQQEYLMQQVYLVDLLLRYLPHCEDEEDKDKIMIEIRRMRYDIVFIEDMTRTEKQKPIKKLTLIIESRL